MLRLIARLSVSLLSNAFGLIVASFFLSSFSVHTGAFIIAVLIFSLSTVILGPLITKIALTSASYLMGGIALITTFAGLFITNLLSDGISINGLQGWLLAPLIIWAASIVASLVLPLIIFTKVLHEHKENHSK